MLIVLTLFFICVALVGISFELREIRRCLQKRIKPSAVPQASQPTDKQYNAACIHCGETKDIRLWPHRNGHGDMIGLVFACAGCADIVRGITLEIHGVRGHSEHSPRNHNGDSWSSRA